MFVNDSTPVGRAPRKGLDLGLFARRLGDPVISFQPSPERLFLRGDEFARYMHSPLLFFSFPVPLRPYQGAWWSTALISGRT